MLNRLLERDMGVDERAAFRCRYKFLAGECFSKNSIWMSMLKTDHNLSGLQTLNREVVHTYFTQCIPPCMCILICSVQYKKKRCFCSISSLNSKILLRVFEIRRVSSL